MNVKELLKILDAPFGVSGFEDGIANIVAELFRGVCDTVQTDKLGNVIAALQCGKENAKKIMIEAHMDEIGLMVKSITDDGFLLFTTIGGIDTKILPATEVIVHGKKPLFGIIGAKPPHLQEAGNKKAPKIEDMAIDIGLCGEKAKELISIGDVVTFKTNYTPLLGKMVAARAQDDRAGLAVIMKCLKNLKEHKLDFDIVAVATVQEEVGLRGAAVAAYGITPDVAVSIDVCHGDTPDAKENTFKTGKGIVITRGPNIHPALSRALIEIAKENKIPYQIDIDSGNTGTNAWAIQVARTGIPTILLSVPVRYMHTNYETLNTSDVESCAKLLALFLKNLNLEETLCY